MKKLELYRKKRDFKKTPEPSGKKKAARGTKKKPPEAIFVIQKHAASHLHYDVRLEIDGVLKSWAVPKGPSLDPRIKRLAMPTEDHPMDYADFEGVIPAGNYGAGNVIIWDHGTYVNLCHEPRTKKVISASAGFRRGHVMFWLKGKKLQGGFVLTRRQAGDGDGRTPWFLFKVKDDAAQPKSDITAERPESVVSGATVESIAKKRRVRTWGSRRKK